ncbi:MAG: hypothetical protein IJ877_00290 [Candidatus Gastranaerophilales bacterium]|nr:hypothetical protein [Candidatus Gastranaerophilales bacterium]
MIFVFNGLIHPYLGNHHVCFLQSSVPNRPVRVRWLKRLLARVRWLKHWLARVRWLKRLLARVR